MAQVGRGDQAAFEKLVELYYERVLFVIEHLMGDVRQADDLAQEVFLRIYRARLNYRPECKFSTWLFVIVNNVVRNARRSLSRRREVNLRPPLQHPELAADRTLDDYRVPGPVDSLLSQELGQRVRQAIDELNSRQRTAILLFHFGGLSYAEVAESMETTLCAAKALLHRARTSLRGQLQHYACSEF